MAGGDEIVKNSDPNEVEQEEEEEEEMVDPQDTTKGTCSDSADCDRYRANLEVCNSKVGGSSDTEETCEEELFDFLHCVDSCVSKSLFQQLK